MRAVKIYFWFHNFKFKYDLLYIPQYDNGRSPVLMVGSNPTECKDVCLFCVLSGRDLCDELITRPTAFLPTVARRCV
jgi:hypothetical protein